MNMETITNDLLTISVSPHGAELCSIKDRHGNEYLWQADPAYWKRHAPVLFPVVGSLWDGRFRLDGREHQMSQHGFARDSDFTLVGKTPDETLWELAASDATMAVYPRRFRLRIGYRLASNTITVSWTVRNEDEREMPFQIGAHPAFYYPERGGDGLRGYLRLDCGDSFTYVRIGDKACAAPDRYVQPLDGGCLRLDTATFDIDTFIIDGSQVKAASLLDRDRRPRLTMRFDSPQLGVWSPPHRDAPFVCIEPWYGRCDRVGFEGEFRDRDNVNVLAPGGVFRASYTIVIDKALDD